jgi:glycosyltransferase involved in cell wall biosynthesis
VGARHLVPAELRSRIVTASAVPRVAVDLRALVPAPTGIGVYTRSLLLELAGRPEFQYLGLAHAPIHHAAELRAAGVEFEQQRAPLGVLWQQLLLPRRLRRGDVDLLWSPITTLPLRSPVPGVVTVHDLTALLLPETHRWKNRWSVLPFLRASLEGASRIVAISHATAADVVLHFPQCADKVRVIHNGIDAEFVPADAATIAATRTRFGAAEGYFLYAGTLEPRKGVDTLLEAWELLARERQNLPPLLLAGPYGWGSARLLRHIQELKALGVLYLGRLERPELVRLFQGALAFVYPSTYEGFGLPAAEALACGVPVIASTSSSLPEVVGDAGILVEPGDAAALAQALGMLLGDPLRTQTLRERTGRQAARFTWRDGATQLTRVFADALR